MSFNMNDFVKTIQQFNDHSLQSKNVIFTIGVSASGKSTWAKEFGYPQDPHVIIIERDQIRQRFYNWMYNNDQFTWDKWNWSWENIVTAKQRIMLELYLQSPQITTIIISDTNCKATTINDIIEHCEQYNSDVHYYYKLFDIDINEAIKRDSNRVHSVGEEVIEKQFNMLNQLKLNYKITT